MRLPVLVVEVVVLGLAFLCHGCCSSRGEMTSPVVCGESKCGEGSGFVLRSGQRDIVEDLWAAMEKPQSSKAGRAESSG